MSRPSGSVQHPKHPSRARPHAEPRGQSRMEERPAGAHGWPGLVIVAICRVPAPRRTHEPHVHSFTASQQLHEAAALRYPYLRNKTKAQRGCVCVPRAEGRVRIQASSVFQAPAVPSWSHFAF